MEDPAAITSSAVVVGVAAAARVPAAAPSAPSAAVATAPPVPQPPPEQLAAAGLQRQVFSVELRHGETTIVSWKKLLKEAGHTGAFSPPAPVAASEPAFASHAGLSGEAHPAENEPKDPAQPNRFSAVIEKIERLYMGKHSSDEEDLDDVPDDDQYDTEDSFIDDTELDEYFEVDNLATKHNGYFVNKGKLEQIEPGTSTNVAPKKRRRKDASSTCIENNQVAPGDHLSIGNMPAKASARSVSQVGKKLAGSNLGSYGENYYEDNRAVKNKINAPEGTPKKKSTDFAVGTNTAAHLKTSSKEVPLAPSELKDFEKHKASAFQSVDFAHKSRTSETYGYTYAAYRDKDVPTQLDFQQKKAFSEQDLSNKVHRKEKHGIGEFPGTTASGTVYSTQVTHPVTAREGSGTKAKGTRLERAIRDLQKIVAAYRPPTLDVHEVDPNCQASVKRRLPQEVKQKLAKVARLSASQGKISEHELIDRLMGIVGHLVQRRTLKKNMKEMVESGLSAKQEKADRFQQVKMEINEMIKARVGTMYKGTEQPDGSADDFQDVVTDERRALKGKSFMDTALEDRICDLYDLYVEGMDEDKGPQSRKLYVELAELWPQGYMDNVGVKDAISRSKERRRLLYSQQKVRNEERLKRKRLAAAAKLQDGNPAVVQTVLVPQVQPSISNSIIAYPVIDYGQNQGLKSVDRVREIGPGAISNDSNRNVGETKKKKRKSESDTVDIQANPLKAPQQHGNEKQKPPKHADDANVSSLASKASVPILGLPSYDQQPS